MHCSKQTIYCNNCGTKLEIEFNKLVGGKYSGFSCCSIGCLKEIQLKEIKSNLNK